MLKDVSVMDLYGSKRSTRTPCQGTFIISQKWQRYPKHPEYSCFGMRVIFQVCCSFLTKQYSYTHICLFTCSGINKKYESIQRSHVRQMVMHKYSSGCCTVQLCWCSRSSFVIVAPHIKHDHVPQFTCLKQKPWRLNSGHSFGRQSDVVVVAKCNI